MARRPSSLSAPGILRRLAAAAGLSLCLFGCEALPGSGGTTSPPAAEERVATLVLDAFTLSSRANRIFAHGRLQVTEAGRKFYREASPEAGFPVDERGMIVPTEFEPSRWEAYLCLEMEAAPRQPAPALPVVAFDELEDGTRIQFFLEAIPGNPCYRYDLAYLSGKGFRVAPHGLLVGILTIEYR